MNHQTPATNSSANATTNSNLLPEGEYSAKPIDAGGGKSASKGTHYARVKFEITKGPFTGRTITQDFYLTERTWENTDKTLRVLGWNGSIPDIKATCTKPCSIVIEHEERTDNQGNKRLQARVRWVNGLAPQFSKSEADELAELMRGWGAKGVTAHSVAPLQSDAVAVESSGAETGEGEGSDDLPF